MAHASGWASQQLPHETRSVFDVRATPGGLDGAVRAAKEGSVPPGQLGRDRLAAVRLLHPPAPQTTSEPLQN